MHLLAGLAKDMPDWELNEEEGCLLSGYDGDGWCVDITLTEFPGGLGLRALFTSNIMFPQEALPNIGLFFLYANRSIVGKYCLAGPEWVLASQWTILLNGHTDHSYITALAEHARDEGVVEMASMISYLQKIAYGGLTVEQALELLDADGIPQ